MSDDETTVVIGRQKTQGGVYHTQECSTYPHNPREITRGEARRRGLHECSMCDGSGNDNASENAAKTGLRNAIESGEVELGEVDVWTHDTNKFDS